jgi:hypothetical protein
MAQTDARAGFRLPWSSDRQPSETLDGESTTDSQVAATTGWPGEDTAGSTETATPTENATDAETTVTATQMADPWATPAAVAAEPAPAPSAPTPPPARKPTKFMADLTKAMQAAAEDARSRALTQLQADAKGHVEAIHGRSSTEAAGLRRAADDDVAAVREWSKAEIARVREETEAKITDRKGRLESEIEEHAGVIEREIDAVQKTVAAFEDEMAAFFERLLGEEDPSRFATMAENLPEAPSFEGIVPTPVDDMPQALTEPETMETEPVAEVEAVAETQTDAVAEAVETESETDTETEAVAEVEAVAEDVVEAGAAESTETTETDEVDASGEASTNEVAATDPQGEPSFGSAEGGDGDESGDGEIDREAAFAAIQAAAEAAASAEVAADAAARAEAVADVAIEIMGNHEDEEEADPRFAALGLSPDYDAAEAEALLAAGSSTEEIPEIDDDALAARIAGLVPGKNKGETADSAMTQVVVVGLVSVASIASFKRHLGRVSGVQSVGVSSGPDGEFVFAVKHAGDAVLRDAIPSLPSFQARVTGSSDGVVHVTAHDPEGDA